MTHPDTIRARVDANAMLHKLETEIDLAKARADRLRNTLVVVRGMITGDLIEHAIVNIEKPTVGLGKYIDAALSGGEGG